MFVTYLKQIFKFCNLTQHFELLTWRYYLYIKIITPNIVACFHCVVRKIICWCQIQLKNILYSSDSNIDPIKCIMCGYIFYCWFNLKCCTIISNQNCAIIELIINCNFYFYSSPKFSNLNWFILWNKDWWCWNRLNIFVNVNLSIHTKLKDFNSN